MKLHFLSQFSLTTLPRSGEMNYNVVKHSSITVRDKFDGNLLETFKVIVIKQAVHFLDRSVDTTVKEKRLKVLRAAVAQL